MAAPPEARTSCAPMGSTKHTGETAPGSSERHGAWQWRGWVKRLVFVLVLAFVIQQAWRIAAAGDWSAMQLHPVPIAGALVAYWLGWLPSVWLWRWLLLAMDRPVSWRSAIRAYYVGHLGKYVPGKAMVLVLRSQLLGRERVPPLTAALSATYETLLMMGVGLCLGLILIPLSVDASQWKSLVPLVPLSERALRIVPLLIAVTGCVSLPLASRLFQLVAWKVARHETAEQSPPAVHIPVQLVTCGAVGLCAGWFCHGASLALVVAGVGGPPFSPADWPFWTGAVALATSVGFLAVFAPGGLGVREGLLIGALLLHPQVTKPQAVAAAVLLRGLWLVAEAVAGAVLYWGAHGGEKKPLRGPQRSDDAA
ncbi:MAG: UPF0104 family protein [Planctomycetota bacterium]|nr:MAG: UPF0104 family protein [Planctomycetota bacterium]